MRVKSKLLSVLAGAAALATGASLWADTQPNAAAAIKQTLESRFAGAKVIDVQPSPIPGLYEVYLDGKIYYADATAEHLVVGSIIETRTKTDLTQARLEERGSIDFKTLPFDKAIKVVRGTGARQLAAFEDPDCPYCQKLERELASIKDTTVYIFLYPIDALHPQASVHARAIWCAPNPAEAWTGWLTQRKALPASTCTKDPVGELAKLGDKLNVDGTPTMFFPNGRRVSGAIPTQEIEKLLVASAKPGSNPTSAPPNAAGAASNPAGAPAEPTKTPASR